MPEPTSLQAGATALLRPHRRALPRDGRQRPVSRVARVAGNRALRGNSNSARAEQAFDSQMRSPSQRE
jgi:hypothetical protein